MNLSVLQAVILDLVAAAAVCLAEQEPLSRRRKRRGGEGEQAKPVGPQHTSCHTVVSDLMQFKTKNSSIALNFAKSHTVALNCLELP